MRIAYLTEWSPYEETGVLQKLIGQVAAWQELGATAKIFSLVPLRDEEPALGFSGFGAVYGTLHQRRLDKYPAFRLGYVNKVATVPALASALTDFAPDIIYYRQNGPWYPGLGRLLAIAPTVIEINTDEGAEHRLWGAAFNALYRATQGRILDRAAGFVSVTHELAGKYQHHGKPIAVVANSFWGDSAMGVAPSGNSEPAFVFVGSRLTSVESWHGVDKILGLARAIPASTFHVIGHTAADFPDGAIPDNMILHGPRSGAQVTEIFRVSDVGIGTMALHRKQMEEACPLKVRDYLMHRLPVIIGYSETEERLNGADYVLSIGNRTDNVERSVGRIREFARRWCGRRVDDDLAFMSRQTKERQRLDFLARIANARSPAPAALTQTPAERF